MIDLVVVHGPILSAFIRYVTSSDSDFDGLLLGDVRAISEDVKDDDAENCTKTVVEACVTAIRSFPSTLQWYTPSGHVQGEKLAYYLHGVSSSPGSQLLGWVSYRTGAQLGRPSVRDQAICADLVARKAAILDAAAAALGVPRPPDVQSWPLLHLQAALSSERDGAVLQIDTVVSELCAAPAADEPGCGPVGGFTAERRPLHVQNISKLGGAHLYKHFRPSSVLPLDLRQQNRAREAAETLADAMAQQYWGILSDIQGVTYQLGQDVEVLKQMESFVDSFERQYLSSETDESSGTLG